MSKVALITGANQGLGFGLLQNLSELYTKGDTIYLAVRRIDAGNEAVRKIKNQEINLEVIYLDATKEDTIESVKNTILEKHGGIDVVISNAAARISPNVPNKDQVAQFVTTNNLGAYYMIKHFQPILKESGQLIVVASSFGSLLHIKGHLHSLFDTDTMTMEDINTVMKSYVKDVESGQDAAKGWPEWINIPSKIGQVALTRIAAKNEAIQNPNKGISIFSVCPGLVGTDASRPFFKNMYQAQPPYEAAKHIIELLKDQSTTYSGKLIQFGKELPWD
nr:SDR family NAD(P)-dependent oxidoreductase [Tenacibaculum mesophilum]